MRTHTLTPQFILDRASRGQESGTFDAVCLFVDLSGFTPLTLSLMAHGTEGAEVLADVLVAVFEPLIEVVVENGGFIAGFAGDAFKAIFPLKNQIDNRSSSAPVSAVWTAWRIRQHLTENPIQSTRFGDFSFAGKVCAAMGSVLWQIWHDAAGSENTQQAASIFGGEVLQTCMSIDPFASAGDVILTQKLVAALPDGAVIASAVNDYLRIDSINDSKLDVGAGAAQPWLPPAVPDEAATRFFPQWLLSSPIQGEFRQAVSVFVNFERSFSQTEMDEFQPALFQLINQYDGFLGRIGQIGGRDNGNTLLLFWGAPTGSERDASRALGFLLDLQASSPVRLRAGVTTHMAYAGFVGSRRAEEYTCYGSYVNLSARLLLAADWGEVWLDAETSRQADRDFQTVRRGAQRFKGFADPIAVFMLQGRQVDVARSFYSGGFVGRALELETLARAIAPIFCGAFAGMVTIEAEAGLGKSRLVHEFEMESAAAENPPRWFLCQTDEILRQPLNPFRYWLRRYFSQSSEASAEANRAAFDARLADICESTSSVELADELLRVRSFLAAMVDLSWPDSLYDQLEPLLRLENMLAALKTLIKAESTVQPVILLLEDAHWLDQESRQFLEQLTRNVDGFPFAVLATQRPSPDLPSLAPDETRQTAIQLSNLGEAQVSAIIADLLEGQAAPSLVTLVMARANGNPFFVEQLVLLLRDEGSLEETEAGWQLNRDEALLTNVLPGNVRALLTARLDRLPMTVKEVVQTASVLGREFDRRVLAEMIAHDADLDQNLAQAGRSRVWSVMDEARYLFRHALLRDAAYDMQLRTRLRRLHLDAAAAVRTVYAGDPAPHYAALVHHYHQGEDRREERHFATLAGETAAEAYANDGALRFLERAIELTESSETDAIVSLLMRHEEVAYTAGKRDAQASDLNRLSNLIHEPNDPRFVEVQIRLGNYARVVSDYDKAIQLLNDAVDFASQIDDLRAVATAHSGLGKSYRRLSQYAEAKRHLKRALDLATIDGRSSDMADILYHLGLVAYQQGDQSTSLELFQQAFDSYEVTEDLKGQAICISMFGAIQYNLGEYSAAQQSYERGLEICRTIGWRHTEAHYFALIGNNYLDVGNTELAKINHETALSLLRDMGDLEGEALSLDVLGLISHEQAHFGEAVTYYQKAIAIQEQIGDETGLGYSFTHCGYAHIAAGQAEKARSNFKSALAIRNNIGEQVLLIDSHAGAAMAECALDDRAAAYRHIMAAMDGIAAYGENRIEYPVLVYLMAYRVFSILANDDAIHEQTAREALGAGLALLNKRAEAIADSELRVSFVENVSFNRELLASWRPANSGEGHHSSISNGS